MSRVVLRLGSDPLPFFAEVPYYLWGEVNYDSDGDCKRPTDRAWSYLALENRESGERLLLELAGGELTLDGDSAEAAAALVAERTAAVFTKPEDHAACLARTDRIRAQFLDPDLAAFDSFGWWGGWKWVGAFATDMTSGLRVVLQSVHERRLADPGLVESLRAWLAEPPEDFHREGVAFAVDYLGRLPSP
ncbi:MAG: hypothetical protein ABI867_15100 [Kofleriaceae bacterium]